MYLHVTIHAPVGQVVGTLNYHPGSEADLKQIRDNIQQSTDTIGYMVVFAGGDEILVPGDVVRNSVIEFSIRDVR